MPALVSLILVLAFLSALQSQGLGLEYIKSMDSMDLFLSEDRFKSCYKTVNVTSFETKIDVDLMTEDCVTCQNETRACGRRKKASCYLNVASISALVRKGMKLCANFSNMNLTACESFVHLGDHPSSTPRITCMHRGVEICSDKERLILKLEAYNFCTFKGQISITPKPRFYRLKYECPFVSLIQSRGTLMSYYSRYIEQSEEGCPVVFQPSFDSNKVCIKFRHAAFSYSRGAMLRIMTYGRNPLKLTFSASNPPSLDNWECHYDSSVGGLSLRLESVSKHFGHAFILEFDFAMEEKTVRPYTNDDSDDSSGLPKEALVLIAISSVLVFLCCCCCMRCYMKNSCKDEDDVADQTANVPFDTEDAPGLTTLSQRDMDEPVVHSTVRGRLVAMNHSGTTNHSSSPSRNHHLDHIPLSTASNDSSYRDLANDEDETSLQFLSPAANQASSSASDPPPSYDSLFPDAGPT